MVTTEGNMLQYNFNKWLQTPKKAQKQRVENVHLHNI